MSPRPGMLGRSALLLAMMACLPDASQQRVSDDVEDLLRRFWTLCPDLASPETRAAIFEDLKARCSAGRSLAGACSELGAQLEQWANGGRDPVLVYDEPTGISDWRGRVLLQGPGQYIAEASRAGGEDRTIHSQGGLPTSTAASKETVAMARRLQTAENTARYLASDGPKWASEEQARVAAIRATHDPATCSCRGLYGCGESDHGYEQRVRQAVLASTAVPEAAPSEASAPLWGDLPVHHVHPREFAVLREAGLLGVDMAREPERAEMSWAPVPDADGTITQAEFDRQYAEHLAQQRKASAPIEVGGGRAGELNRIRRRPIYEATPEQRVEARRVDMLLHPAGKCTCGGGGAGDCDWCRMDRRRAAREERPAKRAEQHQRRAAKAKQRARRGWA